MVPIDTVNACLYRAVSGRRPQLADSRFGRNVGALEGSFTESSRVEGTIGLAELYFYEEANSPPIVSAEGEMLAVLTRDRRAFVQLIMRLDRLKKATDVVKEADPDFDYNKGLYYYEYYRNWMC
jgi:hypothetical protein